MKKVKYESELVTFELEIKGLPMTDDRCVESVVKAADCLIKALGSALTASVYLAQGVDDPHPVHAFLDSLIINVKDSVVQLKETVEGIKKPSRNSFNN